LSLQTKQSFDRLNSKLSLQELYFYKHSDDSLFTFHSGKKADCTISMADSDMLALMTGQMNPQTVRFNDGLFLGVC